MVAAIAAGLGLAQTPQPATPAPPTLTITGDIPTPQTLKAEDLANMPREKGTVTEQDGTTVEYEGVLLREILKRAGAPLGNQLRGKALASYILAKAHDGYEVVFTLGEIDAAFANEQILIADKRDGKPLFGYQGPFRLTIPADKAGARSVRMLETIEVVRLLK
jgi:DMSO/TMAO reductase YedYZ molybdopterin-dependent catalytic subunit